jgi:hypothetical protein
MNKTNKIILTKMKIIKGISPLPKKYKKSNKTNTNQIKPFKEIIKL